MKFAIGFVIYNPENNHLKQIKQIVTSNLFEVCMIYDNSQKKHNLSYITEDNYFYNGINDGLPKAYNCFLHRCKLKHIDYLCIMDQDSTFECDEIKKMQDAIIRNNNFLANCALVAPRSYIITASHHPTRKDKFTNVEYVINSGSFLNLRCLCSNNLKYDENIYLDGVDYDFCKSAHSKNMNILIYEGSFLQQRLGYSRYFFGKGISCHNVTRHYYMAKARKYNCQKHFNKIKGIFFYLYKTMGHLLLVLLFEDQKYIKIKVIISTFIE